MTDDQPLFATLLYIYIYIHIYIYILYNHENYHNNGSHALGHMMYSYTLLLPMNQSVLKKQSKWCNISGHKWSTTHRVPKSHKSKMGAIYICSQENNVPTWLSLQWLCGKSCTWACDVWLHIAGTNEPECSTS